MIETPLHLRNSDLEMFASSVRRELLVLDGNDLDKVRVILADTKRAIDILLQDLGDEMAHADIHPADKVRRIAKHLGEKL